MEPLSALSEEDVLKQRSGRRPRSHGRREGGILHFDLTSEQLAEGGLICGGNIDIFLEPLKEEFLDVYREVVRIKQKGGAAVVATLISVDDVFPEGDGSKVLMKASGEKVGSLLGGTEMEQRILRESEAWLKEKKPKVMVFSPEEEEFHGRRWRYC